MAEVILVTTPDRLARCYAYQVVLAVGAGGVYEPQPQCNDDGVMCLGACEGIVVRPHGAADAV